VNKSKEKGGLMDNKRQNLKNIYDVINKIARAHKEKGEDVSSWFYSREEFEEIKKDPKNKIL
jgi:hypothetical protein